jgi:hypothetical protein
VRVTKLPGRGVIVIDVGVTVSVPCSGEGVTVTVARLVAVAVTVARLVAVALDDLADGAGEPPAGRATADGAPAAAEGDAFADAVGRAGPGTLRRPGLALATVVTPVSAEATGSRPGEAVSWRPGPAPLNARVSSVAAATAEAIATPAAAAACLCLDSRRRALGGPIGLGKPRCIRICNRAIA